MLKKQKSEGRWYAAICASPAVVFEAHGLLAGVQATCYPDYHDKLTDKSRVNERVVVSDKCGMFFLKI